MSTLKTEHIFVGSIESVFSGIRQFKKYPKYLPGVTGATIYPPTRKGSVLMARFEIDMVKTFYYTLSFFETPPTKIWWDLEDSNLMAKNKGSWELSPKGPDKTLAIYTLESEFDSFIVDALAGSMSESMMPSILEAFQKMITDHAMAISAADQKNRK